MIALALLLLVQDTTRLTLTDAVNRALARYPQVAAARAAHDHAAADLGESRAALLPRLSFDGSLTRFDQPMLVLPLHGFPTGPGATLPLFDRTLVQGYLSASYTLYDFGQRHARIRAAELSDRAADAAVGAAEQAVIARAATGYLDVLTARGVLEAQDEQLAALAAESTRTASLLAEGKAARVDVLRVEAELGRSRADRIATLSQLDVAEHNLAQLTELPYDTVHAARFSNVALADTALPTRDALMDAARGASPVLLESRRRSEAAAAAAGVARSTRFPQLQLLGRYVDNGRAAGNFEAEWQAGVGVSWPLFTGGARASEIRRSDADARAAALQLQLADLGVGTDLDRTLAQLREARARIVALQDAVAQSVEVERIERLSLDVGSGTQTDFLIAEASLLSARASLVEAHHAALTARIELARLTGELSPDWLAHALVEPNP